ncbi:TetR/AcrR family transcriptional regulator [Amycolatopsis sp. K13G38]|uniref:TetR/AcrR family transcriptional regulator n=1 Tax=Amycolatopsis acididurans TaxID=2724524 RepID=A0ABX1JCI3_9PSEU|nr:TetR family transcriptional regulator [Amycolatopsis acididurans]NKQ56574.1 TetR/AcrR family transcriptional regulator [Amycolatopsis acididurans]
MARAGRRPGPTETREQIIAAARRAFAEQGYDGATVRGIAAEAGVNAALLHHFFGTKQQLFVVAMNFPIDPAEQLPLLLSGPPEQIGERVARLFLALWGDPAGRAPFLAMLRSVASNEQAATMLRQFMVRTVLARLAEARGVPPLRVTAAAAQMIGLVMLRYVVQAPPLVDATDDEIVELIAPVLQNYLTPE